MISPHSPIHPEIRLAGFFPGLGSRSFYRDIGGQLPHSGSPEIAAVYEEAADALGLSGPAAIESLAVDPAAGRLDRQGALGAGVLVHSLALHVQLRARAAAAGYPLDFLVYTGESFGILAAAVAAGALTVADGARIARTFTPLVLLSAGERDGGRMQNELLPYLPDSVRHRPVSEPHHVVGLRATTRADLASAVEGLRLRFPAHEVELHKRYSARQANFYVRGGAYGEFAEFMRANNPGVGVLELKAPTTFLAHSARMRPARGALRDYLAANRIEFTAPSVPILSNSGGGLLRSADAVQDAVLAMTDLVMDSRTTCRELGRMDLDAILELGPGGKSIELLHDNESPAIVRTAPLSAPDADRFGRSLSVVGNLLSHLTQLYSSTGPTDLSVLRRAVRATATDDFGRALLCRKIAVTSGWPQSTAPARSSAFVRGVEIVQHTLQHSALIRPEAGELVVRARLRKRLCTELPPVPGRTQLELTVSGPDGNTKTRLIDTDLPEVQIVHFGQPHGADETTLRLWIRQLLESGPRQRERCGFLAGASKPAGDELAIIHQYLLFHELADQRPGLFEHSDLCLHAGDRVGWLSALAVSGALSIADALALHRGERTDDELPGLVGTAAIPVISPHGIPMQSRRDVLAAVRTVLSEPGIRPAGLRLNANCHAISLGGKLNVGDIDAGPSAVQVVTVSGPDDVRVRRDSALDRYELSCQLRRTRENTMVVNTAKHRRITIGTVNAYVRPAESIVGFGDGGSESMTIFLLEDGQDQVTVRKILSESLTTARWDPRGAGVMLPPFAKARKQAEFLDGLPDPVRRYFPRVLETRERRIHTLTAEHGYRSDREVIYEMTYVAGEEVSGFVRRYSPPPAVIARLYEQIIRVLRDRVHSIGRIPAPGETLETSYFRKIEDRLQLCRRTAPKTFGPALLDSEFIVIDGASYLNSAALLRQFRENPLFREVLEPRYHSLVVGDTNTENIKIGDTRSLLHAQRVIESGGSAAAVDAAVQAITEESLDLRFLDPRAIGFAGTGRETRDDPMYDNKPWHNSIGHYDEIHYEHFSLSMDTTPAAPRIAIRFTTGNPYQRSYRVRDLVANGGRADHRRPRGLEDHFAPVMSAALDLADPDRSHERSDPFWLVRFVFMMGQHFTAMPPFHFQRELDGTLLDSHQNQRRPIAIYCEGIKWLNWSLQMLQGRRTDFLGIPVALPDELRIDSGTAPSIPQTTEGSSIA
ncbi:ACP S-malonyltransferase [Amycolatopsis pithecellobii]|uniref:ACP S-malonyltransferase n=1 Tax=Amycolatopsis pithecellobii TaxID=664692 RepID=UPI001AA02B30|nr:ACP S-malonyltransferase [Amycolatopsis pithecellobii]